MIRDPVPSSARGGGSRLEGIDVLRGAAALWVVLSHYLPYWNRYLGPEPIIVPNLWGQYAVWLFFVISGYVIFATLEKAQSVGHFAFLRASRLLPAYWFTLLFSLAVSILWFGGHFWPHGVIANLTMFQEFIGYPNFDNVYWSLTVELGFYLNAAWLFGIGMFRRPLLIGTSWLLLSLLWVATGHHGGVDHDSRSLLAKLLVLDYSPFFVMGILFHDARRRGWSLAHAGLVALALFVEGELAGWWGLRAALVIVLLIWLALYGGLRRFVSPVTLWLGAISYSLYLVHRNLGYESMSWLHSHGVPGALAIPLVMAGALALASMVTYLIERPAMGWLRGIYARRITMKPEGRPA